MRSPRAGRWSRWGKRRVHQGLLLPRAMVTPVRGGGLVRRTVVLVALIVWLAGLTHADDTGWIDESKLGVLAHDIRMFGLGRPGETGADVNVEVLFASPAFLRVLGAPRLHLGLSVNTAGATDYGYVGLTWSGRPWRPLLALPDALFVAGSLGGSVHDGYLNAAPPGRKRLGSRLLFRESVEVGYQLTRRVSVSALYDHLSNAGLAHYNQSLNNLGIRVGVTF
jgi:lipid A 3-O-deacylase